MSAGGAPCIRSPGTGRGVTSRSGTRCLRHAAVVIIRLASGGSPAAPASPRQRPSGPPRVHMQLHRYSPVVVALAIAAWAMAAVACVPDRRADGRDGVGDAGSAGAPHMVAPGFRGAVMAPVPSGDLGPASRLRLAELTGGRSRVDLPGRPRPRPRATIDAAACARAERRVQSCPPHRPLTGLTCFSLGTPPPQA